MTKKVIIGSRGSDLALWQAHFFKDSLAEIGIESEIKIITTKGDQIQHLSFDKIEGKGFFTKEIETALIKGEIDVAVHSHKDLETQMPDGLCIAGVSHRAQPADVLLVHPKAIDKTQMFGLKANAVVGTSSARRKSQIKALRGDIDIKDIRGNVPTRIEKLRDGDFDAILLAAAGLDRLQLSVSDLYVNRLDPRVFIPAPAQGVLAYQCREAHAELKDEIKKLHNQPVADAVEIERGILAGFGGGCHIPIGAYARPKDKGFSVSVSFGTDWNKIPMRVKFEANDLAESLGKFELLKNKAVPKSVIVTRNMSGTSPFLRACSEHRINAHTIPFIRINYLDFELPKDFDWVFFASSNAVKAFFSCSEATKIRSKRIACYGEATAQTLNEFVNKVDLIPAPGQPREVAAQLVEKVGTDQVLFPTSSLSLNTIANQFPSEQRIQVCVYETFELSDVQLGFNAEAYIFTSPSNVRGFFASGNEVMPSSKVIAIGSSTAKELTNYGIESSVAEIPHEAELFSLVFS